MPLRIHGLATSESTHGLGRTVSGSVYPKDGGGLSNDPTEGAAWMVMKTLPPFPTNADDFGSEAMQGPTYGKNVFDNDVAYGVLQDGLPLTPYPFLFVGKVWDGVAADPAARIKWSATWNGEPIRIAEEGRDFLAPNPADTGWSPEAQALGVSPTLLPPQGAPTVGGYDEANEPPECLGRPIVAACRRYCFVYPDLPVASSSVAWDEATYSGMPGDRLPYYSDPDNVAKIGVLNPSMLYAGGGPLEDTLPNPRRSVFPSDMGPRCAEGVLVLTCDVYASDAEDATLLVSRQLTLNISAEVPSTPTGSRVTVVRFTLPVDETSGLDGSLEYYIVNGVTAPLHSVTVRQYLLPEGYEFLLAREGLSADLYGWDAVLTPANELLPSVLFPEGDDPVVWPVLRMSYPGIFGSPGPSGEITADSGDPTQWTLTSLMSVSDETDIAAYPQALLDQLHISTNTYGRVYETGFLSVVTEGSSFDMVLTDFVLAHITYEKETP